MTDDSPTAAAAPVLDGGPPEGTRPRAKTRRLIGFGIAAVIFAVMFIFVLPSLVDWGEVWEIVRDLTWPELALLAGATTVNILTFAPPWITALPGLRPRQALVVTLASTASTFVAPGGPAVGIALSYAMLRGWAFETRAVALAVTLTGIWNQLALLAFPVVALGLLTLEGGSNRFLQTVALVGALILVIAGGAFALALRSEHHARGIGTLAARGANRVLRLVRRGPVRMSGESFVRFRSDAIELLRLRWHVLTLATLAGQLAVFGVLVASLWALDILPGDVDLIEAFAAWSIARLLGSIPLTPAGLGIVDVGVTTVLAAFGGSLGPVVAAVLVYRFLTIVPTLALGLLAGATWRKHTPDLTAADS